MRPNLRQLAVIPVILLLVCCFPIVVEGQQDVVSDTGDLGYDSLSTELKSVYTAFGKGIDSYDKRIKLSDGEVAIDDFEKVLYAYQSDHPEKFWASYYTRTVSVGIGTYATAGPAFTDAATIKAMSAELEKATSSISVSGDSMGDKMKNLQNQIIDNVSYEVNKGNSANIYGVFVEKKCKCDGYSLAVTYLCKKIGISSLCVIGYITDEGREDGGHAWNIVKMDDGKWYYLDATWDDVSDYRHRYDYFLIGTNTSTPHGTIADTRTVISGYGINVSTDKYDYDPFAFEHTLLYIAIAVLVIVLIVLVARAVIKSRRAKPESIEEAFSRYEIRDGPAESPKEDEKDDDARRNG